MSISYYEGRIKQLRRELEQHRKRQADDETKAARLDGEAARLEQNAARSKNEGTIRSYASQAQRKRSDAQRSREGAAKASQGVATAQINLHKAEADLRSVQERERRRQEEKAKRDQDAAKRAAASANRARESAERQRELELVQLRQRTAAMEAELEREPWSTAPPATTVLFIAASPEDQDALRVDREVREIQERVRMSEYRESVQFAYRPAAQPTDLLQAMNEIRPHVVHFSGHGDQAELAFEDADGNTKPVSNADLATLLKLSSERIRLAIFNACESAELAELACEHIDAAIGMDQSVDDEAAKVFAAQFYSAVGFGKSLAEAFEQAKLQVRLATGGESGAPRLYTAAHVDAADVYLVRPPTT